MIRFLISLLILIFGTNPGAPVHAQDIDEMFAKLKHPENIAVELARRKPNLHENSKDVNKPFGHGERLYFRILLTNTSVHPTIVFVSNPYFQNRPSLLKEGREISYLDEALEKLSETLDQSGRTQSVRLDAGVSIDVSHLDLSDWYAPLTPGHYELTNKYRFVPNGDWLKSPPITFEVLPKKRRQ